MKTSSQNKRKERDIMKLLMSNYEVSIDESNKNDLYVKFHGPKNSPYENGIWKIHVLLPDQYPYKSPSIGFYNKIYHPNVDENSGTICLDVINQTWSPMFDLINIFDEFLPQLLLYPNPSDPLNSDAAKLLQSDPEKYNIKIKDYVKKFASDDIIIDKEKFEKKKKNFLNNGNCNQENNNFFIQKFCHCGKCDFCKKSKEGNNKNEKKENLFVINKNININEDIDDENSEFDINSIASSVLSKPSLKSFNVD